MRDRTHERRMCRSTPAPCTGAKPRKVLFASRARTAQPEHAGASGAEGSHRRLYTRNAHNTCKAHTSPCTPPTHRVRLDSASQTPARHGTKDVSSATSPQLPRARLDRQPRLAAPLVNPEAPHGGVQVALLWRVVVALRARLGWSHSFSHRSQWPGTWWHCELAASRPCGRSPRPPRTPASSCAGSSCTRARLCAARVCAAA